MTAYWLSSALIAAHAGEGEETAGGPTVRAGHEEVVDLVGGDARILQGVGEGGLGQGHVGVLPEALLPHL